MRELADDVGHALRALRGSIHLSALIVLTLAVGIGANTAVFTVIEATLLRALPYEDPEQIVAVWETSEGSDRDTTTSGNVFDWREQNDSFDKLAAYDLFPMTLSGRGQADSFRGGAVTEGFFRILRAQPALGRSFETHEFEPGPDKVVILSHNTWRARFGADESILGEAIIVDGTTRTVIGVLRPAFRFVVRDVALWIPLALDAETRADRKWHWIRVIARLKDTTTLEHAQADMETIAARLTAEYPEWMTGWGVRVVSLREDLTREARRPLLLLLGAVGMVLLIACVNVANLLLARGAARGREMALRAALGAGRWRLTRQLLVESVLLSLVAATLGALLGRVGVFAVLRMMPAELPRAAELSLDWRVAGFTVLVAIVTGIGFGLAPARRTVSADVSSALAGASRVGMDLHRVRLGRSLVVTEVALSLVLLMGAALLVGSFVRLMRVDTGIEPGEKLVVALILPIAKYPEVRDQVDFFSGLMESLRTLPGVRAVESTTSLPLNQSAGRTHAVFVEGRPIPPPGEVPPGPHQRFVTEGYFRTMSIPLLRGRIFDDSDSKTLVLLINETMAEKIWPGQDPIGQRLSFEPGGRLREIIGIVGDTKDRRLEAPAKAAMYAPHAQREWAPISWAFLVIDTFGEPTALAPAVRTTVNVADPTLDIYRISTMREEVSEMFSERRFGILVLGLFAASALLLASVGVFSVLYYEVSQRRREIGVRMALGATARDIWRLFMSHGMRSVLVGLALGCLVSLVLTRFIESMLFEVSATDPAAYAAVALLLSLAALTACYLPAKRAARVTPAESIRQE